MSDFSRNYETQITGREGMAWVENGVKFYGMKEGILLDAKALYGQFIDEATGRFYSWFTGADKLVEEALRQIEASDGARIQWYFAEEKVLNAVKDLFARNGITEIDFIFKTPK